MKMVRRNATDENFILAVDDLERELHNQGLCVTLTPYTIWEKSPTGRRRRIIDHEIVAQFPGDRFTLTYGIPNPFSTIRPQEKSSIVAALNAYKTRTEAEAALKTLSGDGLDRLDELYYVRNGVSLVFNVTQRYHILIAGDVPQSELWLDNDAGVIELIDRGLAAFYKPSPGQKAVELTGLGVAAAQKLNRKALF